LENLVVLLVHSLLTEKVRQVESPSVFPSLQGVHVSMLLLPKGQRDTSVQTAKSNGMKFVMTGVQTLVLGPVDFRVSWLRSVGLKHQLRLLKALMHLNVKTVSVCVVSLQKITNVTTL
jgi:hypothetical protein